MANQIYQTRKGVRVALTAREVKAYVMKERGWTSDQYKKKYDILRNSLRAYEGFLRKSGIDVEKQSPSTLLYFESKARKREGKEYKRTIELDRIYSFPSISSGKALSRRLEGDLADFRSIYSPGTFAKFGGFIKKNPKAAELVERIEDPVKLERALIDYANKLYVKIKENEDDQATTAIPFGQAIGSDSSIDFDIESYL